MLIFERKNTVGGASALFLFVETTGWRTGKPGGNGRGKGIPVGGALTLGLAVVYVKKKRRGVIKIGGNGRGGLFGGERGCTGT